MSPDRQTIVPQVRHTAALAARHATWLRDEGATSTNPGSSRVQQPRRSTTTQADHDLAAELRQRPSATQMPLDGKERAALGSVPVKCPIGESNPVLDGHSRIAEDAR